VKRWVINKLIYINIIYLSPTHHLTVLKTNTQKYWQWLSFGYGIESIFIFLNFSFISSNDEAKKCSHFFNAQNYCFFGKPYILLWRNSYCYIFLLLFYFCFSLFLVVFAFLFYFYKSISLKMWITNFNFDSNWQLKDLMIFKLKSRRWNFPYNNISLKQFLSNFSLF
jgi:hypothetical protein